MKTSVYGTTRTIEQTEAIVSDLRRAGFGGGDIVAALPAAGDTREFAHVHGTTVPEGSLDSGVLHGGMLVSVHVENPNQRNAARDIFQQHDAQDITTGSDVHAAAD